MIHNCGRVVVRLGHLATARLQGGGSQAGVLWRRQSPWAPVLCPCGGTTDLGARLLSTGSNGLCSRSRLASRRVTWMVNGTPWGCPGSLEGVPWVEVRLSRLCSSLATQCSEMSSGRPAGGAGARGSSGCWTAKAILRAKAKHSCLQIKYLFGFEKWLHFLEIFLSGGRRKNAHSFCETYSPRPRHDKFGRRVAQCFHSQ